MKVLAIGDIHTKTFIIDLVEAVISEYDAVVFCGDYADDWGASASDTVATWTKLRDLARKYPMKFNAVRGNHDYIYTEQVPGTQSGYNYQTQLLLNSPDHVELKEWLRTLPLTLVLDGVTYSHAGIDERWDGKLNMMSIWSDTSPLWVRPDWAQYKNIPQVVGHTPQRTVNEVQPGIWLIDTYSTDSYKFPIGDGSMLVITDGTDFQKININANNNYSPSVEDTVS